AALATAPAPAPAPVDFAGGADGADASMVAPTLLDVPLEELLSLESTSVAKKRQRVSESAAAVYVITQDDIRRSTAGTIPDLLRMVPGVEVGNQISGGSAVSIRGFNSRVANSLLVMVDGRSIYVSTLSGVFWDQLLIPLGDIERIEVVRGPGATLWGANAVGGVINIVTKHSSDTLDTMATGRASARAQSISLSHGARFNDVLSLRVYGTYRHDNGLVDANGADLSRRVVGGMAGARLDWQPDVGNAFTLQAEYGDGSYDMPIALPSADLLNPGLVRTQSESGYSTHSLLGRWTHQHSDRVDWSVQAYYSQMDRVEFGGPAIDWAMADLDFGLRWQASAAHDISIGVGAREMRDELIGVPFLYADKVHSTDRWISGYAQDDISLIANHLRLTLGAKLERNNFTGFEFQPSARLFLRANAALAMWGSVSRAVRTPSRFERDAHLSLTVDMPGTPFNPSPLPVYSRMNGVPNRGVETLVAYEAGIRATITPDWSVDIAGYVNDYKRLTALVLTGMTPLFAAPIPFPVGLRADLDFQGVGRARTWGVEAALTGRVAPWWKVELTYSHFNYRMGAVPGMAMAPPLLFSLDASPRHQARWRNAMDFGDSVSADVSLRYVSALLGGLVPDYVSADARFSYRTDNGLELSIIGENLLQARRAEFVQLQYPSPMGYTARAVSVEARFRF
ncbi:MAG: TonB-dependent receptor plug domain-containing protein, partial [Sphingopyxis sp.]